MTLAHDATLLNGLLAMLRRPGRCSATTLISDGSRQPTDTWVDTDDVRERVDTMQTRRRVR